MVYSLIQTGEFRAVYQDGKWFVERASVEEYSKRRATAQVESPALAS
jgi:hypothetical protein